MKKLVGIFITLFLYYRDNFVDKRTDNFNFKRSIRCIKN